MALTRRRCSGPTSASGIPNTIEAVDGVEVRTGPERLDQRLVVDRCAMMRISIWL